MYSSGTHTVRGTMFVPDAHNFFLQDSPPRPVVAASHDARVTQQAATDSGDRIESRVFPQSTSRSWDRKSQPAAGTILAGRRAVASTACTDLLRCVRREGFRQSCDEVDRVNLERSGSS